MLLSRWRTSVSSCHPTSAKRVASLRTRIAGPKACCRAELPFLSQFLLVRTYATMAEKTINLIQLLSACIDLAHQAGKEIKVIAESGDLGAKGKDKHGNNTGNVTKADVEAGTDAVTRADMLAQEIIEGSLRHHFKGLHVVGEEDIDEKDYQVREVNTSLLDGVTPQDSFQPVVNLSDVTVFVDPLDATMEFVIGNKFCTICLIGISVKGDPLAGIMYQPFEGEGRLLWAMLGFGAADDCKDDSKNVLKVQRPPIRQDSVCVTTRLHNSPVVEQALEKLKPMINQVVRVGGAGYKVLTLLETTADLYFYPTPGTKKWDTCGPEAILRYFGGKITDVHGDGLGYTSDISVQNSKGIVATRDAAVHDKIIALLK